MVVSAERSAYRLLRRCVRFALRRHSDASLMDVDCFSTLDDVAGYAEESFPESRRLGQISKR